MNVGKLTAPEVTEGILELFLFSIDNNNAVNQYNKVNLPMQTGYKVSIEVAEKGSFFKQPAVYDLSDYNSVQTLISQFMAAWRMKEYNTLNATQ